MPGLGPGGLCGGVLGTGPVLLRVYHFLVFVLYKSIIRCVLIKPSSEKVYT